MIGTYVRTYVRMYVRRTQRLRNHLRAYAIVRPGSRGKYFERFFLAYAPGVRENILGVFFLRFFVSLIFGS